MRPLKTYVRAFSIAVAIFAKGVAVKLLDEMRNFVVGIAGLVFVLLAFVIVVNFARSGFSLTKEWFMVTESVSADQIVIDRKPHDCDFDKAPLGNKECHFEKIVSRVLWATSTSGNPIRSFDNGKTWEVHVPGKCDFNQELDCPNVFDPPSNKVPMYPTVTGITIAWRKVQD
jgi:hypothetical protein